MIKEKFKWFRASGEWDENDRRMITVRVIRLVCWLILAAVGILGLVFAFTFLELAKEIGKFFAHISNHPEIYNYRLVKLYVNCANTFAYKLKGEVELFLDYFVPLALVAASGIAITTEIISTKSKPNEFQLYVLNKLKGWIEHANKDIQ